MQRHKIPRSIYEKIRSNAREEVYDAIYRDGAYLTNDDEMRDWLHSLGPENDGVELIEDTTPPI